MPDKSIIDTSTMSEGQRAALEMAEDSRDTREISGFAGSLFMGFPKHSGNFGNFKQTKFLV